MNYGHQRAGGANTQKVKSFSSGEYFYNLIAFNGKLFFIKHDLVYGTELWQSDGTDAGTTIVKDIYSGGVSSNPSGIAINNGKMIFAAQDAKSGYELWGSDGTDAGTVQIKDINTTTTENSNAGAFHFVGTDIAPLGNGVLFDAYEPEHGTELYRSDGSTAGTKMVNDILPGEPGSFPYQLLSKNNRVYFVSYTSKGASVYRSNGTKGGTQEFAAIDFTRYYLDKYTVADNGLVYYVLYNFFAGSYELWRSDGTTTGTYLLSSGLGYSSPLVTIGNKVFFTAGDYTYGYELWKSNGTVAGTKMIKDIFPGTDGSNPYSMYVYNNEVYFGAISDYSYTAGLWKSDGTDAGTVKVADVQPITTYGNFHGSSVKDYFCVSNNLLYFSATSYNSAIYSYSLFKTDGTTSGTQVVSVNDGSSPGPIYLTDVNGTLFYTNLNYYSGYELWRSDGSFAGTTVVKNFDFNSPLDFLCNVGGKLYFTSNNLLWSSNGKEAGTKAIEDPSLASVTNVVNLVLSGDKLFFNAYNYKYGSELWVGNTAGASFAAAPVASTEALKLNTTLFNAILYPNPVQKNATLQITGATKSINITVIDIAGRKIWQRDYFDQKVINISTEKFAKGVYMLIVKSDEDTRTIKFIKE